MLRRPHALPTLLSAQSGALGSVSGPALPAAKAVVPVAVVAVGGLRSILSTFLNVARWAEQLTLEGFSHQVVPCSGETRTYGEGLGRRVDVIEHQVFGSAAANAGPLRAGPGSVPHARHYVSGTLFNWNFSGQLLNDAEIVTSELVTNAVQACQADRTTRLCRVRPITLFVRSNFASAVIEIADPHRSGEPVTGPVGRVSPRWGSAGQPLVNHALKSGDSRAVSRASVHFGRRRVASPGGVRTKAVTFEEP